MEQHTKPACTPVADKYIRLAKSVAQRFVKDCDDVDNSDAFGNAMLALVEASQSWLPSMNTCFSTYARRCIFNALVSEYRKQNTRRLPQQHVSENVLVATPQRVTIDPEVLAALLESPSDPAEARDHQIVLDRFLNGKSYSEVGDEWGLTKMGAWEAVRRGIARIRRDHARLLASDVVAWELPEGDLGSRK